MVFRQHAYELRGRLLYLSLSGVLAWGTAFLFSKELLYLLTRPLLASPSGVEGRHLIFTHLTEAFLTHLWLAFGLSLLFVLPFGLAQVWFFLRPGLYPEEGKVLGRFLLGSPLLLGGGLLLAQTLLLPVAWSFFLAFENRGLDLVPLHLEAKVSEYLSLSFGLFLGTGLLSQYPLLLALFLQWGLLQEGGMVRYRKVFLLGAFLLGAICSPPDLASQLLLATPLLLMYECLLFSLVLARAYRGPPFPSKEA